MYPGHNAHLYRDGVNEQDVQSPLNGMSYPDHRPTELRFNSQDIHSRNNIPAGLQQSQPVDSWSSTRQNTRQNTDIFGSFTRPVSSLSERTYLSPFSGSTPAGSVQFRPHSAVPTPRPSSQSLTALTTATGAHSSLHSFQEELRSASTPTGNLQFSHQAVVPSPYLNQTKRPILSTSVAQNLKSQAAHPVQDQRKSAHRNETYLNASAVHPPRTAVQRPLSWAPISVHHPVDAQQLSQEAARESARESGTKVISAGMLQAPTPQRPFLGQISPTADFQPSPGDAPVSSRTAASLSSLLNSPPRNGTSSSKGLESFGQAVVAPLPAGFRRMSLSPLQLPGPQAFGSEHRPSQERSPTSQEPPPSPRRFPSQERPPVPPPPPSQTSSSTSNAGASSGPDAEQRTVPVVRPRMGEGERRIKQTSKDNGLNDAVKALADYTDNEVKRIAAEWGRDVLTVKKLVGVHRRFREKRMPSLYNALMHKKAQEYQLQGKRFGPSIKEKHDVMTQDADIQEILNNPDCDEAKEALDDLKSFQEAKISGARASSKANDNDIVKTWNELSQKAQNLSKRTSAATFGFVCSSKPNQNVTRQFFGNGPIEAFLMAKFNMTGAEFVEAAEGYLIFSASGRTATAKGIKTMQEETTKLILQGLRDVTGNPKLNMEYEHYEVLIVKEYGVQLTGWPNGVDMVSAHKLHAADTVKLYQAVESRSCKWKKLEARELHTVRKGIEARIKSGVLPLPERLRRSKK